MAEHFLEGRKNMNCPGSIKESVNLELEASTEKILYEPYENRKVEKATTFRETLFHMLKASLGTGILAMPNAFKNAGYLVGTVGTVLIGIFSCYCMNMMVLSGYELCKRKKVPSLSYPELVEAMLSEAPRPMRWMAPYGRMASVILLIIAGTGTSCIYVIFVAENLKSVADQYVAEYDVRTYMILIFFPILFLCWIRNLKYLAPVSTVATAITFLSFGITIYYVFTDVPSFEDRHPVGNLRQIPLFFGTVMFSISAIGMIMPLENEMAEPSKFSSRFGVLNISILSMGLVYASFGVVGYLKYGKNTLGSITLNLPNDDILAQSVKVMLSLAIWCTFPLPQYIIYNSVWVSFLQYKTEKGRFLLTWIYFTKTVACTVAFAIAILIPKLELIISLIGSLFLPLMAIAIPSFANMVAFWDSHQGLLRVLFIMKHVAIFIIAIVGCYTGVQASMREILIEVFHVKL